MSEFSDHLEELRQASMYALPFAEDIGPHSCQIDALDNFLRVGSGASGMLELLDVIEECRRWIAGYHSRYLMDVEKCVGCGARRVAPEPFTHHKQCKTAALLRKLGEEVKIDGETT